MRRRWVGVGASLVLLMAVAPTAQPAAAFGTIEGGGQHRAHERISRAALACYSEVSVQENCFQPRSMDLLAGHDPYFGGVGAPDSDEISDPAAHCDNADFLADILADPSGTTYPRSSERATAALIACVDHLRGRFGEGATAAAGLIDGQGGLIQAEVVFDPPQCQLFEGLEDRAKCAALEGLGRALHGAQDFYSHSNWADEADPARPLGDDNPPGLNLPGPSPVLDLRGDGTPDVPAELATGCYTLRDQSPGVGECTDRVTHAALNKDNGLIDPVTGAATEPTRPRGMVGDNFSKAVTGAIAETQRQWEDFQSELSARYGEERADLMICALTHDDPVQDCPDRDRTGLLVGVLAAAAVLTAGLLVTVVVRRRRRPRN